MFRFLFITLWISSAMIFAQHEGMDEASHGITNFINVFDSAWNAHDSKALSALWIESGDLITPWGQWIRGQSQIAKYYDQEKMGPFGKSTIQQSIDTSRFLTPQLVQVDATIKLSGIEDSKGFFPSKLVLHGVYVLAKIDHSWQLVSARIFQFQSRPQN